MKGSVLWKYSRSHWSTYPIRGPILDSTDPNSAPNLYRVTWVQCQGRFEKGHTAHNIKIRSRKYTYGGKMKGICAVFNIYHPPTPLRIYCIRYDKDADFYCSVCWAETQKSPYVNTEGRIWMRPSVSFSVRCGSSNRNAKMNRNAKKGDTDPPEDSVKRLPGKQKTLYIIL